jgi:hypothetical protein
MNNPCNDIPIGSKETNIFTFANHIMMSNFLDPIGLDLLLPNAKYCMPSLLALCQERINNF